MLKTQQIFIIMIDIIKIIYYNFNMKISKGDIKGILKILLIIILVGCAIGCTCYLFFKYLNRQKDSYAEVSSYLYSIEREELASDLNKINDYTKTEANSKGKLVDIIQTLNDANVVTKNIVPYLSTYDVDDEQIVDRLDTVKTAEELLRATVADYLRRAPIDITFDKGDVAEIHGDLAGYLVEYSNLIITINHQVEVHSKYSNVDVKFSVIDCYARVLNKTFAGVKPGEITVNSANLDVINYAIKNNDGYLLNNTNLKIKEGVAIEVNDFIKFYNQCNKDEFASNINNAGAYTEVGNTAIQKAYHYFNVVFMEVA